MIMTQQLFIKYFVCSCWNIRILKVIQQHIIYLSRASELQIRPPFFYFLGLRTRPTWFSLNIFRILRFWNFQTPEIMTQFFTALVFYSLAKRFLWPLFSWIGICQINVVFSHAITPPVPNGFLFLTSMTWWAMLFWYSAWIVTSPIRFQEWHDVQKPSQQGIIRVVALSWSRKQNCWRRVMSNLMATSRFIPIEIQNSILLANSNNK
jgi:hypothetical protein